MLGLTDILCANFDEAKSITGQDSIEDVLNSLQQSFEMAALKLGNRGCFLINKDISLECSGLKVRCWDTTGAGDAFIAALLYGVITGYSFSTTGKIANWLAAQVVQGYGARNFPSNAKIKRFLSKGLGRIDE